MIERYWSREDLARQALDEIDEEKAREEYAEIRTGEITVNLRPPTVPQSGLASAEERIDALDD